MPQTIKVSVANVAIKVDGTDLAHEVMDVLHSVEVETSLYLPSMFIMRFYDGDLALTDGTKFPLGGMVEISAQPYSYNETSTPAYTVLMKGEITGIEPVFGMDQTALLTIVGYDKRHRLTRGTRAKTYVNVSDSDVVQQVCSAAGVGVSVESTSAIYPQITQFYQTDLELIYECAERSGFEVAYESDQLKFRAPQSSSTLAATLTLGENILEFTPRLSLVGQVNEVKVKSWNRKDKAVITGTATGTSGIDAELGSGDTGPAKAQSSFGTATYTEVRYPVPDQSAADKLAKSLFDQLNAGFVEAEGRTLGNPALAAGKWVEVVNFGTKFSGKYLLTSVTHTYNAEVGYETYFKVEGTRPRALLGGGGNARTDRYLRDYLWGGVVPAVVTNVKDEGQDGIKGRLKVKFPWLDDTLESYWAPMVSIGGGAGRGMYWMPEVDDEVLVAFEHGDFNRPYIIGTLWNGSADTPETAANAVASDGKVKVRMIKTRLGHTIKFMDDESEKYIEIKTANGKVIIKMDDQNEKLEITCTKDIAITAQGKLDVKTTGDTTIKSDAKIVVESAGDTSVKATGNVSVESTGNTTIKATGNANVEASGNLTLKGAMVSVEASGILTLKGSMVNIN